MAAENPYRSPHADDGPVNSKRRFLQWEVARALAYNLLWFMPMVIGLFLIEFKIFSIWWLLLLLLVAPGFVYYSKLRPESSTRPFSTNEQIIWWTGFILIVVNQYFGHQLLPFDYPAILLAPLFVFVFFTTRDCLAAASVSRQPTA